MSVDGGPFRVVRDFSQDDQMRWRPELYEHDAVVRVTVKAKGVNGTSEANLPFRTESRIKDSRAVAVPTSNPLIALLSAPGCEAGSQFRGAFQKPGDSAAAHTSWMPCVGARSSNVYVAGMHADSEYQIRPEVMHGSNVQAGPWMPFHTGMLDGNFPIIHAVKAAENASSEPLIVHGLIDSRVTGTDLDGKVMWYLPTPMFFARMLPGGSFLVLGDGANSDNSMKRLQLLLELDLEGNIIRETNVSRVAEQLGSRGISSSCKKGEQQCVSGFHHDAVRLPNGHTLVIASLERMFPAGAQGSKEPVDIMGDLVIDLDADFQVAGVWNAFDRLDVTRAGISNEKCGAGAGNGGCAPVFLSGSANGWLHANSINYIAAEGNFLLSLPEQNWVIKVDWRDGKGTGKVLWRLGEGGSFTAKSDDPAPWFSYQHDVGFAPPGSQMLALLDDVHSLRKKNPAANNRGQVWKLDEATHTATLVTNADLGGYSFAVGSSQLLKNGDYAFDLGLMNPGPGLFSRSVEVSSAGTIQSSVQVDGAITYRSYRVSDMYSAPDK